MTAPEAMAAAPPTVGDRVAEPPTTNGNGAPTGRRRLVLHRQPDGQPPPAPLPPAPPYDEQESRGADRPKKLTRSERRQMGRLRARKVKRVVRHVDPWSVLKVSLLFYLCLFVVLMVAGVVLWNIAAAAGTIGDIESFFKDAGAFQTFSFDGFTIFRATSLIGLILVVAGTGINVLLAVLFNLISDLVGGVRFTVIEEESARPVPADADLLR
jgi:hypothetical protein